MEVKIDLVNAFDKVRHSFLLQVLENFSFEVGFVNWIKACISGLWIDPLVNGRPFDLFQYSRGLRQWFPLSPLLYIIMVDSLSRKL